MARNTYTEEQVSEIDSIIFTTWLQMVPRDVRHALMLPYTRNPVGTSPYFHYDLTEAQERRLDSVSAFWNELNYTITMRVAKLCGLPDPSDTGMFECGIIESMDDAPTGLDIDATIASAERWTARFKEAM